jgi:hypothetical protein
VADHPWCIVAAAFPEKEVGSPGGMFRFAGFHGAGRKSEDGIRFLISYSLFLISYSLVLKIRNTE